MAKKQFDFVTDTATLCVFDLAALKHRLTDASDWWSIPRDEVAEMNTGNVAFIGLGCDGRYIVEITEGKPSDDKPLVILLNCPSGRVFLGAGEEVTGGRREPTALRGGTFLDIDPGVYRLTISRTDKGRLLVNLSKYLGPAVNCFAKPARLL